MTNGRATVLFDALHIEADLALAPQLREMDCRIALHASGLEANRATLSELAKAFDLVFRDDDALRTLAVTEAGEIEKSLTREEAGPCLGLIATEDGRWSRLHRSGHEPLRALPPPMSVVDTTGASDAFVGAFLSSWLCQGDIVIAQRHAVQAAGLSVTALGAQGRVTRLSDLASILFPNQ